MTFNTNIFIFIFLPLSVFSYKVLDQKFKDSFLFIISLFFYFWSGLENFKFIILLIIINYLLSFLQNKFRNKLLIIFILSINIFILFYFKYIDYVIDNLNQYFTLEIPLVNALVPLGISFIVFHIISYQVDIYKDKNLFTKNFIKFGLYITFFPKISQGPIVKWKDFKKHLNSLNYQFDFFISGIERFIIGLGKKVIIADVLLASVNTSMSYWHNYGIDQPTFWLISTCYFYAIYFDFSGYSDMAIGIARMFGFNISENFNFPYLSKSITEFWRRWHISLGAWFKEYVYIPLGGNKKGNVYFHLLVVFILTGVWHGAGLLYLAWGMLHGIIMLIERFLIKKAIFDKIPSVLRWFYTTFVVALGWLIFLIPSSKQLFNFIEGCIGIGINDYIPFEWTYILNNKLIFALTIAIIGSYIIGNPRILKINEKLNNASLPYTSVKYAFLIGILIYSLLSIVSGTYSPFIYFQF